MKWSNGNKMRLLQVGFVTAIVLGNRGAKADFTFGEPTNLGPTVNSPTNEASHSMSADNLELYFASRRAGGVGGIDLWVSTRLVPEDEWGSPTNLGPVVNSPVEDMGVCLSPDGLELYFQSTRAGGLGSIDIWVARRITRDAPWGEPENLGAPINTTGYDYNPCLSSDGLALYFAAGTNDETSLVMATRETTDDPWGKVESLGPVINNWPHQDTPWVSRDGLLLMFSDVWLFSPRPGGFSGADIWFSRRTNKESEWSDPVNAGSLINSVTDDECPMISADGSILYFNSERPGGFGKIDLWQAPILPTVDFTGDGQVDIEDLLILIESWGQNNPSVDMGPMPWGDGVVDAADLDVLMSYWGQEPYDPHLLAHWKLDGTEGDVAYDSAGANDATVIGDATWEPENGIIGGALQLDGTSNYIQTPCILDPAYGSFSVFAWVKAGAPGQVVLSQDGVSDWLRTDRLTGCLESNIIGTGRSNKSLTSKTVVTDSKWHCVGLVWDGAYRSLYVDDELVARDTVHQGGLESSFRLFNIGAGKALEAATFWAGMIDDVRIYNRVVTP
jgi:hypothetical protein